MNIGELDLVILKHITTSKRNALEFVQDADDKLFSPDAWKIARQITEYVKVYREVPTLKVLSERARFSKNEALLKYIEAVWKLIEPVKVVESEFKHDLEKFKNKYKEKLVISLKSKLAQTDGSDDIDRSITEVNSFISNVRGLNKNKIYEHKTIKEGFKDFRSEYMIKMNNPKHGAGLKTGFDFFDAATGGLQAPCVVLIGAESGVGKSLMLSSMGYNLFMGENTIDMTENFKDGNDVVYLSLEMSREKCQTRLFARAAMVPQRDIRDATLSKENLDKLGKFAKFVERYPYEFHIIDAARRTKISDLELIYNNICEKSGRKPKVVIIDYLSLMEVEDDVDDSSDHLRIGILAERIHEFAKMTNTIVLTATQLNRAKKGQGNQPFDQDRIARSSQQAANVDYVLLLEKRERENERCDMNVHIVKNRDGENGIVGRIYKNLKCCALLNKPEGEEAGLFDNSNDISESIEGIN